ncbi:MAG: hypothetical protein WC637_00550 [Victivallales bacterium]|jgi:hypothetical protein
MANMVFGTYTLVAQPNNLPMIQKARETAYQKTYSSVALFSWGASYIGKVLELTWTYMPTAQYTALLALYVADAPVVFNPQDGSGKTFNVEIISLDADYFVTLSDATGHYRKNIKMRILIMSEV